MKKLNNKGMTLVELIVSFLIVSVAMLYFFQTLRTVQNIYKKAREETQKFIDIDYAFRIVDAKYQQLINNGETLDANFFNDIESIINLEDDSSFEICKVKGTDGVIALSFNFYIVNNTKSSHSILYEYTSEEISGIDECDLNVLSPNVINVNPDENNTSNKASNNDQNLTKQQKDETTKTQSDDDKKESSTTETKKATTTKTTTTTKKTTTTTKKTTAKKTTTTKKKTTTKKTTTTKKKTTTKKTTTTKKGTPTGKLAYPLPSGKGKWSDGTKTSKDHLHYSSSYGGGWHGGNDLTVAKGTNVYAMDGGVIVKADTTTNKCSKNQSCKSEGYVHFGKFVLIKHVISSKTYYTVYGHLNKISVKVGDKVNKGDKIGESGNTGNSTGAHLHVGMSYNKYDNNGYPIYSKNVIAPYVYITGDKKGKSYVGDTGKNK